MKVLFVVNPAAGQGRAAARWRQIEGRLRAEHPSSEAWRTRGPGEGAALARQGLERGFEAVIAVGGDGTLSEVVHGFLSAPAARRAGAAVGAWPLGSGCDTARHLGLSSREGAGPLLALLASRRLRRFDAGRVRYSADDGSVAERYFINIAAFGLAGTVARAMERTGKRWGSTLSYLFASLGGLLLARAKTIHLVVDGKAEPAARLHLGVLANFSTFGGGMRIARGADAEDGLLDFVTVASVPRWRLLAHFPKIYRGTHFGVEGIARRRVRRVEASADTPVWLNIDGEAIGRLPAVFEVVPGAVPFLA